MNTTVDALKALYVALGGTASDVADVTLIPDMITAIAGLDFFESIGNFEKIAAVMSVNNDKLTINASGGIDMTAANKINILSTGSGMNGAITMESLESYVEMSSNMSHVAANQGSAYISSGTNGVNVRSSNKVEIDTSGDLKLSATGAATLNNKAIATTT